MTSFVKGAKSEPAADTAPASAAPVFVLSRETLFAHLQFLPEAFARCKRGAAEPEAVPRAYLLVVSSGEGSSTLPCL